jgi:hypothetical protein
MKKTLSTFLILLISILFYGCNKDNPVSTGNNGSNTTTTNTFVKGTPYVYMNAGLNYDTINVTSTGTTSSLSFSLDTITDINATQMEVFLVHNNIIDTLIYQLTNVGTNFIRTVFSDGAENSINTGSGNYTGTYKPYRPLSIFNGQNISGQWILIINKFTNNRTGVIKSWGITVSYTPIQASQWVQMSNGIGTSYNISSLAVIGNNIFAGVVDYGVYISNNNGASWTAVNNGLTSHYVLSLAVVGTDLFVGTYYDGVFKSTNNGANWIQNFLNKQVYCFTVSGNNLFAGTSMFEGVYLSTDNGTSWTQTALNDKDILSLASSGTNIFAGTSGSGVYRSTNNGMNWNQSGLTGQWIRSLGINGNNIFADYGYNTGVYLSTDNGISWNPTALTGRNTLSFAFSGNNIFAGADNVPNGSGGIYLSSNNGTNWIEKNQGFSTFPTVNALLIANGYIFAGTNGQSVWRRNLSEIIGK